MLKEQTKAALMAPARRAFTLVELIVVVLIIAVVIAISLPALGMAKQAARKAKSQVLATSLGAAITGFENDNNRLPGYFSAAQMGAVENGTRGFTTLENALLDLMGGIVDSSLTGPSIKQVGPISSETIAIDLDLIGTNTGSNDSYFNPEAKALVAQDGVQNGTQAADQAHKDLPDLVDAFGTPVLLWVENAATKGTIVKSANNTVGIPFALIDSGTNESEHARYYWNSNAGFLNSDRLGDVGRTQVFPGTSDRYSLIGGGIPDANREESLMGLLGSPSNANVDKDGVQAKDVVPNDSRGGFTIQLAGPDGMYLSSTDKGASRLPNNAVSYPLTWYTSLSGGSPRLTDDNGNPSSKDLVQGSFDDFLLTGAH